MSRSSKQPASAAACTDNVPATELPLTDGSQLHMSQWLRDLDNAQHLFDADVAYFLVTASALANNCKTAVVSPHHSRLLDLNLVQDQSFGVHNPPPVPDGFRSMYATILDGISAGRITTHTAADLPQPPPAIPDHHILAPDRITQLDMKLRNSLLRLITAKGRRNHYAGQTLSGCALLRLFASDAKASVSKYVQSPHTRKLKAQLQELKKIKLTQISMTEFDEVRDNIEEINDELDDDDRMTDTQLCDHYIGLLHGLNR